MQPMHTPLCDAPEVEYLDGRRYPKVSPKTRHSFVQSALLVIIRTCAGERGATGAEWRFRPSPSASGTTALIPDVAFVSRERLARLRGEEFDEPPFSPDIAVEVRSPSDNLMFLHRKIERYLRTGSVLVLDVDPAKRTIRALDANGELEFPQDSRFVHPAAPWLQFDVADAFKDLDAFRPLSS